MEEKCFKIVLKEFIAMLKCNVMELNIEDFASWCEYGNIFCSMEELSKEEQKNCVKIMNEFEKENNNFMTYLYIKINELCNN
jgi:hypothetical protein